MKKLSMSLMMFAVAASSFAKSPVSQAKEDLLDPVDLVDAQKSIEEAIKSDEFGSDPGTYKVAGDVYKAVYDAEDKKRMLNQGFDEKTLTTSLFKSADFYMQCAELEQIPDAKGKTSTKYDKDIKKAFSKLSPMLLQTGYDQFQKKNYKASLKLFESYMGIPNCSIMKDEKMDTTYNLVQYLAISSALQDGNNKTAIKYMSELKDCGCTYEAQTYDWLVSTLQAEKDTAASLEILAEGLKKHPSDQNLIAKQVNYYIKHNQKDQAIKYLDDAIAANPNSSEYYKVKADLYISEKNYAEAISMYQKAQSLDPKNEMAVEGLGEAYAVKGRGLDDESDKLFMKKKTALSNDKKKEATEAYKQAADYLKSSYDMYKAKGVSDKNNLYWLKLVYNRLGDSANYKWANAEYNAAK